MFKVNNKDTRIKAPCSSVSIVNFEQVNAGWDSTYRATIHYSKLVFLSYELSEEKKIFNFLAYPSCHVFQSIIIVSSYQKGKIASRSGIFIVNFEQVNASWEAFSSKQDSVNTGIKLKEHQTLLCLMFNLSLAFNTKASPFTQPAFTCSNGNGNTRAKSGQRYQ